MAPSTTNSLHLSVAAALLLAASLPSAMAAPTLQPESLLAYVPNLAGNVVFGILYTLMDVAYWYHLFKWKKYYCIVLPIATFFEATGFWLRIPARETYLQSVRGLYIAHYICIVLAPAGFLAFNYIIYGRLISAIDPDLAKKKGMRAMSRFSFLPPRIVARVFVISDITTFLIQAAGGGLQTTGGPLTPAGDKVFLIGVTLQGVSYLLFTALTLAAHYRLWISDRNRDYRPLNLKAKPVRLLACLHISSLGILVRSGYRIVEMAQGYDGELYVREKYLFFLDALPLVFAMISWTVVWPHPILLEMAAESERKAFSSDGVETEEKAAANPDGLKTPEKPAKSEASSASANSHDEEDVAATGRAL